MTTAVLTGLLAAAGTGPAHAAAPAPRIETPAIHRTRPSRRRHDPDGTRNASGRNERHPRGEGFSRPGFGLLYTLGFSSTHTEKTTTHLNTELDAGWKRAKWEYAIGLRATGSWVDGNSTSEEYFANGRAAYTLSNRSYAWSWLAYRYNRFAEFQYQANEVLGYGYKAVDTRWHILRLEAGVGGGQDKTRHGGRTRSGISEMARELYAQRLGVAGEGYFQQQLILVHYPHNLFSEFSVRFIQPIADGWSFWAGYRLEHNSESVVPGAVQTISFISLNLSYSFGGPLYGF